MRDDLARNLVLNPKDLEDLKNMCSNLSMTITIEVFEVFVVRSHCPALTSR